mgnify:CR=1 FL=1
MAEIWGRLEKHSLHTWLLTTDRLYNQQFTLYPESPLENRGRAQLSVTQVEFMTDRLVLRGDVCRAKTANLVQQQLITTVQLKAESSIRLFLYMSVYSTMN